MASSQLEQVRSLLRCGVCKDEKNNHKQLPCQHTACKDCLAKIVTGEKTDKMCCPACSKECLVPNGGVAGFPDSLFIKQMADILKSMQTTAADVPAKDASKEAATTTKRKSAVALKKKSSHDAHVQELLDNSSKRVQLRKELEKLAANAQSWMAKTVTKVAIVSDDLATLPSNCQLAKKELQTARDKLKAEYMKQLKEVEDNAKAKIDDIQKHRSDREEEIESWLRETKPKLCQVQDAMKDAEVVLKGVRNKNANAARLERALQKVNLLQSCSLTPVDHEWHEFGPGDSVRLKVTPEDILDHSVDSSFSKVGMLIKLIQFPEGLRMLVVFPGDGDIHCSVEVVGSVSNLTKSLTTSPVPMCDARVRFGNAPKDKPDSSTSEEMISLQQKLYKNRTEGWLTRMRVRQAPVGPRSVVYADVEFPNKVCWSGYIDDIERVEGPVIKPGDKVWIARDLKKPSHKFSGVTRSSCGVVTSISGPYGNDEIVVDFPECSSWKGRSSDVQGHITPFENLPVQVSLHTSLNDTKKWKGATHEDVGMVQSIRDGFNHKGEQSKLATVQFREKTVECELSEIELSMDANNAKFHAKYGKKPGEPKSEEDEFVLPGFDPGLFHHILRNMAEDENLRHLFGGN